MLVTLEPSTQNNQLKEKFLSTLPILNQKLNDGLSPSEKVAFSRYLKKEGLILDIGCGPGRALIPLHKAGYHVIGMDFTPGIIEEANQNLTARNITPYLVQGDWKKAPFKDNTFNTLIASDSVVSYFKKDDRFLMFKEANRILKKGGILILLVTNSETLFSFPFSLKLPNCFTFISKIRNDKTRAFVSLFLDTLSVSIPSFFIDATRQILLRILKGNYTGPKPKERTRAASTMPHDIYRVNDVIEEISTHGLQLIDFQSDWELVFGNSLPSFLKRRSPITYYFIQKTNDEEPPDWKFNEAVILLGDGITQRDTLDFQIISSSMSPFLCPGDIVYGRKVSQSDLNIGDMVIFKSHNTLIAHRLVFLGSSQLVTKGDNNKNFDPPIVCTDILAKIISLKTGDQSIFFETRRWKITNHFLSHFSRIEVKTHGHFLRKIYINFLRCLLFILNPHLFFLYGRKKDRNLEKEIILRVCEKDIVENKKEIIENFIFQNPNWHCFLSLIFYNNIGPLIFKNLSGFNSDLIPSWVMDKLKENYTESFLKTAPFYKDLGIILKEFDRKNISVILLKGAAISEELYEDIALRPLKDIDMLVKKKDWPTIGDTLKNLGYNSKEGLDLLELDRLSPVTMDRHVAYENSRATKFEFKFNLFSLDFPEFEGIADYWEKAQTQKIAGVSALTLSLEDQFLYLSTRMINVGFQYLLWFYDLKEFLRRYKDIDWKEIVNKAQTKKVAPALFYTLKILKNELRITSIPQHIIDELKPNLAKQKIFEFFFYTHQKGFRIPGKISFFPDPVITNYLFLDKFNLNPRKIWQVLKMVFETLFPPAQYIAYRYRMPLWQVYTGVGYVRRLIRLVQKLFFLK